MEASSNGFQGECSNPLLSDSSRVWDELIQSVGPASLLLAIETRLGQSLRRSLAAEDILQEALLHAWNSRQGFEWRGLKSFRCWLLSIIDNRICDAADRQGAVKRGANVTAISLDHAPNADGLRSASPGFIMPAALIDTTTPSRRAMYREQAIAMHDALEHLPAEVRDVVRLRLVEQISLEAIAQTLGIGVAAVRHRFRKGAEIYHHRLRTFHTSVTSQMAHQIARHSAPNQDGFSAPAK